MKKIIAIALLAAMALGLAACGPINENKVAVLWSGADKAVSPNSLINAMDRAMYIENIGYTYYGAEGDAAKQLAQAQEALDAGCAALMVELVDASAAQQMVDLAKAKSVPVIFFGCKVDTNVVASYDKCVAIMTYEEKLAKQIDTMVSDYIADEKNAKKLDRNGDGQLDTVVLTDMEHAFKFKDVKLNIIQGAYDPAAVELIITGSDAKALDQLVKLQEAGLNTDKLNTHYVGLFTVGNDADFKAYVLDGAPEGAEARKAHYEANKYLVDLTAVEAEDLDAMIYTTVNVIDSGRITGTVMEDYDAIAEAAAKACAAMITGKDAGDSVQYIQYTIYTG